MRSLVRFGDLFRDLNRYTENYPDSFSASFSPQVDVVDKENNIEINIDLPGLTKNDVNITLENGVLTVSGKRSIERKELSYSERYYGSFERSWRVPNSLDTTTTEAKMDNGVLTITLNKKEETKSKNIQIR